MRADELSTPAMAAINERLDAMGRMLVRLGGIEKQVAALRLEVQSWKAAQDTELDALARRIAELEVALAGSGGG